MACMIFGHNPISISSNALVENGVDMCNSFSLKFKNGEIAVLSSALNLKMENKVVINGTKGCIVFDDPFGWWRSKKVDLIETGTDIFTFSGEAERFTHDYENFGFQFEIEAVQRYINTGSSEATEITLDESIAIAEIMDQLRQMWEVKYRED
jgi:predicted dehydrogenase